MPANVENGKNLSAVVNDLKEESKQFVSTRLAMLQAEMKEKMAAWKTAIPLLVIGAVMLLTAWLLLTGAIVAAVYVAFADSAWAASLALIIVCIAYAICGGLALWVAKSKWQETGVAPKRTLRVLKDDQIWISNEARAQL
jgi:VIT1/CCC1 family predicted Fe2+/Mn2+ transporter